MAAPPGPGLSGALRPAAMWANSGVSAEVLVAGRDRRLEGELAALAAGEELVQQDQVDHRGRGQHEVGARVTQNAEVQQRAREAETDHPRVKAHANAAERFG